jgi:hypothetical protein
MDLRSRVARYVLLGRMERGVSSDLNKEVLCLPPVRMCRGWYMEAEFSDPILHPSLASGTTEEWSISLILRRWWLAELRQATCLGHSCRARVFDGYHG